MESNNNYLRRLLSRFYELTLPPGHKFPTGYRFCPTEEELILHYLMKKVNNEPLPRNITIPEVDIYQYNPEILCAMYQSIEENEWYFFSPGERKYQFGLRGKRSTNEGYWKASTPYKPIYSKERIVGKWNALIYHQGKGPTGTKTNWAMKEYKLVDPTHHRRIMSHSDMKLDDQFVLCKIYKRAHERKTSEMHIMDQDDENNDDDDHVVSAIMPTTTAPQDHGGDDDDYFSFLDNYSLEEWEAMARELDDLEDLARLFFPPS